MNFFPKSVRKIVNRFSKRKALPKPVNRSIERLDQMSIKRSRGRVLGVSPQFKKFSKKQRGFVLEAKRLIEKNFEVLKEPGKKINSNGIRIERAHTGSHEGINNYLTLKVSVAKKEFFVKIAKTISIERNIKGIEIVNKYLKKKEGKINGFKVKAIMPHLVYSKNIEQKSFFVTDFFNHNEVVMVRDLKNPENFKITRVLEKIGKENALIYDIGPHNAFYNPKTKTILLFDI